MEGKKRPATRREILEGAAKNVCGDREEDYGSPENSFRAISRFWKAYLLEKYGMDVPLCPTDIGLMMALFKISRIVKGRFKEDSFIDGCRYLACAGELAETDRGETVPGSGGR